ncbi:MAG: succinyldiaminopimelate transaminase [Betaproteobacteria bacterium]|jgi:N-succinyldiaminopimelate aminotransferase|nr:succinyldiaminopimelate transaminase [Betaproteobacteria bacterium]NBP44949.1 succinyldiaminopimelate transaminase [Betaproteobacteria bacterium]
MNPLLDQLQAYPFERLRQLFSGVSPNPAYSAIRLGMGEPQHPTPALVLDHLVRGFPRLREYPPTLGDARLRQACAQWVERRYGVTVSADQQVLPVNGSREALFALAQTVVDPHAQGHVLSPNPFYQIYEGAALLSGATPYFVPLLRKARFRQDWDSVPASVWAKAQLVFVCSPSNPTGDVMDLQEWQHLFELSDRYGFVIASDECYSEIYFRDQAPLGGLQAAALLGRHDFQRLVMLTSLSKRSNVPGLRSGFVAGDADILRRFLLYRTYHGSAMGGMVQEASTAAWLDEAHVVENRRLYRERFERITPMLAQVLDVSLPDAAFYLWAGVPGGNDVAFARDLYAQYNVTVLPGSYLSREVNGHNPGSGYIRLALVAETEHCEQAAKRIVQFVQARNGV